MAGNSGTSSNTLFKPVLNNVLHIRNSFTSLQHQAYKSGSQSNLEQVPSLPSHGCVHTPPSNVQVIPDTHNTSACIGTAQQDHLVDAGQQPADSLQRSGVQCSPPQPQTIHSNKDTFHYDQGNWQCSDCIGISSQIAKTDMCATCSITQTKPLPRQSFAWRPNAALQSSLRHLKALHDRPAQFTRLDSSSSQHQSPMPNIPSPSPTVAEHSTNESLVEPEFPSGRQMATLTPNLDLATHAMTPPPFLDLAMDTHSDHVDKSQSTTSRGQLTYPRFSSTSLRRIRAKLVASHSTRWHGGVSKPGRKAKAKLARKQGAYHPIKNSPPGTPGGKQTAGFLTEDGFSSGSEASGFEESTEDPHLSITPFSDVGNTTFVKKPLEEPSDSQKCALRDQRKTSGIENEDTATSDQGLPAVSHPRQKRRLMEDRERCNEDGHEAKKTKFIDLTRDLGNMDIARAEVAVPRTAPNAYASSSRVTLEDLRAAPSLFGPQDDGEQHGEVGNEPSPTNRHHSTGGRFEAVTIPTSPSEVPTLAPQVQVWVHSINEIVAALQAQQSPTVREGPPSCTLWHWANDSSCIQVVREMWLELHNILRAVDARKAAVTRDEAHDGLVRALKHARRLCQQHDEAENVQVVDHILDDFAQRFVGKRWPSNSPVTFGPAQGGRLVLRT
ncbi:hypothetical protein CONPUDRAFT_81999, partial [Coniophora puteana RWD-64-598 SS2]